MIRYNGWANERILEQAVKILPERPEYTGQYGLLADELLHLLHAQDYWMRRWTGRSVNTTENPSRTELIGEFARSQSALETFVAGLDEDALKATFVQETDGKNAPLGDFIAHLVGHGTYHRGGIAILLTNAGASPGDIDLYDFILVTGG